MEHLTALQWAMSITGTLFAFAFGAVAGSFINVLVYRLPRGLNVITPPSACPACERKLTWRENFPIFGWLLLRGKCRFCKASISAEYVIVETIVALLFATLYALWFFDAHALESLGVNLDAWRPAWTALGPGRMLPAFIVAVCLVGSLVAITLIDARTFMIPLALPWFASAVALIGHPVHAWFYAARGGPLWAFDDWGWTLPTAAADQPRVLALVFGGALGIGVSALLLQLGVMRRSFADYEEWEKSLSPQERESAEAKPGEPDAGDDVPLRVVLMRVFFLTGPAIAGLALGFSFAAGTGGDPLTFALAGLLVGFVFGMMLRRILPAGDDPGAEDPIWVQYPHARREMFVELLFLAPCLILGAIGWSMAAPGGPLHGPLLDAALPLRVLGGVLAGYLVGGGIIWGVRIFGTLAFGKEAMGLGDVHLLAAVGAALGWIAPLLAFFTALFLGLGWAFLSVFFSRIFRREGAALPFGPHLAAGALLALYARPLFETVVAFIVHHPVSLP